MNIIKNLAVTCTILVFGSSLSAQDFTVKGDIKGLPDESEVQLIPMATHRDEKPVATAIVQNGTFTLTGETEEPRQYRVAFKDAYGLLSLIIDKGEKVSIKGEAKSSESNGQTSYSFANITIDGARYQKEYEEKMAPRASLDQQHAENQNQYPAVRNRMHTAQKAKDSLAIKTIEQSDEWKALEAAEREFFQTADQTIAKMISDNKDSWWGPLLTLNMYSFFPPQSEHLYDQLSEDAKNSFYGQILKEQVRPEGFLGKQAPFVDAKDADGNAIDLKKLIANKKVIMIDFWASWCAPCRKKIPEIKSLYEKYGDQGLEIIGISIDKREADWRKALGEENLPYPNFLDLGESANNWKVRAIPALFVLDNTGKVIAENVALEEVEALMNK